MRNRYARPLGTVTVLALVFALTGSLPAAAAVGGPVSDNGVVPEFVDGNPTCTSLGYDFGFKVDPPDSGTYDIDGFHSVTVTTDGVYFDWSSDLGMDAVIAKGGSNANSYVYDPPEESFGDGGLASPINPNTGEPFGLSHIEFCFDYELDVSKTAETSFTRTFDWTIEKSVTPESWDLFTGDSGTSLYTVTVTKTGYTDSNWAVTGKITIENNTPLEATVTDVSDSISGFGAVSVNCGVSFPYDLASDDTLECEYSTSLPDGTDRTNTATVTTSGDVGGGSDDADVTFGEPTTTVNDTINVTDTFEGDLGSFSDSDSTTYSRTFTCDDDEGEHNNTATIDETGQSDSASVTVNCYALAVDKDASTSLTRTWSWTIDKKVKDPDTDTFVDGPLDLLLSPGQLLEVFYQVVVDATSVDSAWDVSGNISVENPAPIDATINSVADIVSPNIVGTVDCGVTFPYTLAAGDTLTCTYGASLPDASDRTNTATATLQNYDYDKDGNGTANGTTDFSKTVNVSFADATVTEIDECIDVSDTNVGVLGTVCASDAPETFTYSLWFGDGPGADVVLEECGNNEHTNTCSFVTNDTGTTGEDSVTVRALLACDQGCTLTPGYWKTHSSHGPAPEDDAWFALGDVDADGVSEGADETFFLSGQTYYEVLWTAPRGSAYYILAHAYIAAKLNVLNGASSTAAVDAAIAYAETFFATYTPSSNLSKAVRNAAIANAVTLDNYNNGLIGPGHCSE